MNGLTFNFNSKTLTVDGKTLAIKGGTFNGFENCLGVKNNGKIEITGGTFDFDPSAYVSGGYEVDTTSVPGKYVVKQGHVHSWSFGANGAVFTATCSGEGTCPVDGKVATLTVNFSDGKTYDGKTLADSTLTEETHSTLSFSEATGATIAGPDYTGDRTSAGDHTATWTITAGGTDYKISKTATIAPRPINDVVMTLNTTSLAYTGANQTVNITGVTAGGFNVTYTEAADSVRTAKSIGKYTVKITANGNFTGSATKDWQITNYSGQPKSLTVAQSGVGTISGTTLTVTDSSKLEYDVANQIWYAGLTLTWDHTTKDYTVNPLAWGYAVFTKPAAAQFTIGDATYTGNQVVSGVASKGWKLSGVQTSSTYKYSVATRDFTYLDTTTLSLKLTPEIIEAAKAAGAVTVSMYAGSLPFKEGDNNTQWSNGVEFKTYTITVPIDENLKLYDNDKNQVYPALPYVAQVDGKKKYLTLDAALKAASSGQTVNAIAGCEAGTFTVGKNVTLNLGGNGASGATYKLDADDSNMQAKVVSSKAEDVTTVDPDLFSVSASGFTYTVVHAHVHNWVPTLEGAKLTITCDKSGCKVPGCTTYVELKVTDNHDGNAPTYSIENQAAFIGIVNEFTEVATIGSISIVRTQGDNADLSRWYVGNYRATCDVTLNGTKHTLVNNFKITKPDGGYTKNGWVVGSSDIRYDDNDSLKAIAATETTDTIYYRGDDRNYATQEFSVGAKNLTIDFGGKTLTKNESTTMTLKNTGSGTLTFQNVTIKQPRGTWSAHIEAVGNIAFGTGVLVTNTASDDNNRCKVTSTSGKLSVLSGGYQCKFVADGGSVEISGGVYEYRDHCKPDSGMLKKDHIVRTVTEGETTVYQVVYHEHHYAYSAKDNVISATCDAQDCQYCGFGTYKATLTATETKVYDGAAYAGATFKKDEGYPTDVTLAYFEGEAALTGAPTDVGSYKVVMTAGASVEKAFSITRKPIDVPTAVTGLTYNGAAQTGVAATEGCTVSGNTATGAGSYQATATLDDPANFKWADSENDFADRKIDWSIAKAVYDMSGVTFEAKTVTYNGAVQALAIGGTLPTGVTVSYLNNENKDAGTYTVTATFAGDAANYEAIANKTATLTIERAAVTVTADQKSKTFGETDPALTATVAGTIGEETVAYELSRAAGENVGEYAITVTGAAEQGNYAVSYVNSTFKIAQATPAAEGDLTLTLTYGETLGGKAEAVAGTMKANGKTVAGAFTFAAPETMPTVADSGKGYAATFTPTDAESYNTAEVTVKVTVNRKELTVTTKDETVTYGDDAPAYTTNSVTGFVAGEGASVITGAAKFTCDYEKGGKVVEGGYAITIDVTAMTADNYSFTGENGTLTVNPLAVTVTPDAGQEKTQGVAYAITYTSDPEKLVGTDAFTGALAAPDEIGKQTITQGTLAIADGNDGKNYTLTVAAGVTIMVKPVIYSITYELNGGVNNPANPSTYTITNDTITLAAPTRTGYTFTGWTPDNGVIAKGLIGNRTFYATWTPTVYTVEFRDAVTEETKAETMTYTIETPSPLALRDLPAPDPNYTVKGWLTNRLDVVGEEVTGTLAISEDMLGDKTFYVHFVFQQTPEDPDKPQVVIPQAFLTNIVENAKDKSAAEINEELTTKDANGITKVERYVLQLKDDVPVIQPEQTANTETVRVNVGNIDPLPANVANAKVMYSVVTADTPEGLKDATPGAKQESPTFDLPLPKSGVQYYRVKIDLVKPE